MTVLLNNVDADEVSAEVEFGGGSKVIVVRADDFGGGIVAIEVKSKSDSGNRFLVLANGSFTANGDLILDSTKSGLTFRAVLSGATSPSNVFVELVE